MHRGGQMFAGNRQIDEIEKENSCQCQARVSQLEEISQRWSLVFDIVESGEMILQQFKDQIAKEL